MRVFSRLTLQTKVLVMQVGIVLLVAGLITVTVVSVLERMVEQQTGERALGIAQAAYEVMHSARFVLIDRQGRVRAWYDERELEPDRIVADVRQLLR